MKVPQSDMETSIRVVQGDWTAASVIQDIVDGGVQEDPFYVMDLGEVVARYQRWTELMPTVEPFYAVKCNDDRLLLSTLASLGAGFDCASKAEIDQVTDLGVAPERIIFANPAKMKSHILRAAALGVDMMTFDSETELLKIKHLYPDAQLVLRIRCDAVGAQCPLGMKFGCNPNTEAPRLLKIAALHQLNVIGISFHVGSGAGETEVYQRAIGVCRQLFTAATKLGFNMRLLDLGGGYPGGKNTDIYEVSQVINAALATHFPEGSGVRVIAEPGRYFAAAAYTLATMVHATREIAPAEENGENHTMYFINDGVYGSFNCILYDHQQVEAQPLKPSSTKKLACSVWGPSCDGLDCVLPATRLPRLAAGDWLLFSDMGAYTMPVASAFNGFPVPTVLPVLDHKLWAALKDMLPLTSAVFSPPAFVPEVAGSSTDPSPISTPPDSPPATPIQEHPTLFIECALK